MINMSVGAMNLRRTLNSRGILSVKIQNKIRDKLTHGKNYRWLAVSMLKMYFEDHSTNRNLFPTNPLG